MVLSAMSVDDGWYVWVKVGEGACVQRRKPKGSQYKHKDIGFSEEIPEIVSYGPLTRIGRG